MISSTQFLSTEDLSLASALLSVGVKLKGHPHKILKPSGKTQFIFLLEDRTTDGETRTSDLINAWSDDDYITNNPDCPFAYIKQFFNNREILLDEVKSGKDGYIQTEDNGMIALVNKNASPEQIQNLFK